MALPIADTATAAKTSCRFARRRCKGHDRAGRVRLGALSEENVKRVRAAYEALGRKDTDAVIELLDPAVEFRNPDYAMEAGTRHGHEGVRKAFETGWEVMEDMRWDIEEVLDHGDVIVVVGRFSGRGRTGRVPVETRFGHVLELRDGKATSIAWFQDPAEAFAAAGISED